MGKRWWWMVAVGYLLCVLLVVLGGFGWWLNRLTVQLYLFASHDLGATWVLPEDVGRLLNVLLFVPFGVLVVALLDRGWVTALLVAATFSAAIEVVQMVPVLHREASVGDVVANALGGLLGAALALALRRRRTVT